MPRRNTFSAPKGLLPVILLMIISSQLALGQARTGIYLTINIDLTLCDHKMRLLNESIIYCISEEPILEIDSFEKVSEITYDSLFEMRQFKITLTPRGGDYINTIAEKLPDHRIAVVVDGILVSIINLSGIYSVRSILIWDEYDSHAMEWIHKSLSDSITEFHKKI